MKIILNKYKILLGFVFTPKKMTRTEIPFLMNKMATEYLIQNVVWATKDNELFGCQNNSFKVCKKVWESKFKSSF